MSTIEELRLAVADMRTLQRRWFGGDRSPATLAASKAAERKVDRLLLELASPTGDLFSKPVPKPGDSP